MSRMFSDLTDCQVKALDGAPVATVLRQGPPRYIPGYNYCYHGGGCYWRGGYFVPGRVYSVDVNAPLRLQLETTCMGEQGYQRVELKNCPIGVRPQGGMQQTQVLPPLSEDSCAVRGDNNTWQIIDVK